MKHLGEHPFLKLKPLANQLLRHWIENAPQTPVFASNRRQYRDLTANGEGANRITAHVGRYSDLP